MKIENDARSVKARIQTLRVSTGRKIRADEVANYLEPIAEVLEFYEAYCAQRPACRVEDVNGCEMAG